MNYQSSQILAENRITTLLSHILNTLIILPVFDVISDNSKMDLSSLKDQVSNLTLYDLKAGVRKVQNGKLGLNTSSMGRQSLEYIQL